MDIKYAIINICSDVFSGLTVNISNIEVINNPIDM